MAEQTTIKDLDQVIVRFSGDSGDGMQLAGNIFSTISATVGNDICTLLNLQEMAINEIESIGAIITKHQ